MLIGDSDEGFEVVVGDDPRDGIPSATPGQDLPSFPQSDRNPGARSGFQERIDRLTAERHRAEARAAQLEARLAQVEQSHATVAEALRQDLAARSKTLQAGRIESEISSTKALLRKALEEGDTDKVADYQARIAELAVQKSGALAAPVVTTPQAAPAPAAYDQPKVDTSARDAWLAENDWFGTDPDMTAVAQAAADKMAQANPHAVGRPNYWAAIDREVRSKFPDRFGNVPPGRPAAAGQSGYAPMTGNSGGGNRVRLTADQVKDAARMGLSPEQYAKGVVLAAKQGIAGWGDAR